MFYIFEVVSWTPGLFGKRLVSHVWAQSPSEASRLAVRVHQGKGEKIDSAVSVLATEQDPVAYGTDVTKIINLPMEMVNNAWERMRLAPGARTNRPVYAVL